MSHCDCVGYFLVIKFEIFNIDEFAPSQKNNKAKEKEMKHFDRVYLMPISISEIPCHCNSHSQKKTFLSEFAFFSSENEK